MTRSADKKSLSFSKWYSQKQQAHHSLQWRLTLLITLLMTVTCILMYFFISNSAVTGMENLESYVIQIDPQAYKDNDTPITFNVDPQMLFTDFSQQIQETKLLFRLRSLAVTIVIILLSSLCTYFLSRRVLHPLHKLNEEISQIQAQNLSEKLPVPDTKDEIAQLTMSFNEMLTRLDNAFNTQKQFSASAAHELRTPLAVLQTNLEVFNKKKEHTGEEYQQLFSMVQEQTGRLSHLVGTLLDMTNLKSIPRSDTISPEALVEEVLCDLDSVAEQAQITLIQDTIQDTCQSPDERFLQTAETHLHVDDVQDRSSLVNGSYLLLYRAVYNLVENAIKYNRPGGTVSVSVSHSAAGQVQIQIKDTGIGISPEDQEKIFDPFFRVDKSRSRAMGGAGLGLALVDAIAKEHDGQVKVLKSDEHGSVIALILPATR